MVYIVELNGFKYYACEVCRSLYELEDQAKTCEEHCRTNPGIPSTISKEAIGYINPEGEPQKVFFKIAPLRGCSKTVFKLCRTGVKIYKGC